MSSEANLDDQARRAHAHLKEKFGDLSNCDVCHTKYSLSRGVSVEAMEESYQLLVHAWEFKMTGLRDYLAQLRREEGDCSTINENTIITWINGDRTSAEIRTAYRQKRAQATQSYHHAQYLRTQLRHRIGDCPDVTDDNVFQCIGDSLNVKAITSKYKACFEDLSSPDRRAKRLKARIVEETGEGHGNVNLSEELLIDWFDTGRDDDQIVKLYRQNYYFVKNQI
jgi:hypothetical protein